jgi:serine/threonine protein kinase
MISHYRIISKVGEGGMGEVYLAQDTRLDRKVAIKSLLPKSLEDEEARARLVREARIVAKFDHPNICTVHGQVEEGNQTFIIMQYVEGETLCARIKKGFLKVRETLDITLQVAEALVEAHSKGIIHRDLKPQNVLITPCGRVKVLDFGVAKIVHRKKLAGNAEEIPESLADLDVIVGTAPYMSPEQAMRVPVDERSDLFSLGALLYECLTGKPPFSGSNSAEIRSKVIKVDPPPPSQLNPCVPPELDRITLKGLAKNPGLRYQSAFELMSELGEVSKILKPGEQACSRRLLVAQAESESITLLSTLDFQ